MPANATNSISLLRWAALFAFLAPAWLNTNDRADALQLGSRPNGNQRKLIRLKRRRSPQKSNDRLIIEEDNGSRRRYRNLDQDDEKITEGLSPLVTEEDAIPIENDVVASIEESFEEYISAMAELDAMENPITDEEKDEQAKKKAFLARRRAKPRAVRPRAAKPRTVSVQDASPKSLLKPKEASAQTLLVSSVEELRVAILDKGYSLSDIELSEELAQHKKKTRRRRKSALVENDADEEVENNTECELPFNHEVIDLITERAQSGSKPNNRDVGDDARLALSIEGGGMRGAVSAGMVAAIASLGLCDVFDSIYGSSAGSTIGAYFVSRQMCFDVYTHIIPEAKTTFVSKKRIMTSLVRNFADVLSSRKKGSDDPEVTPKSSSSEIMPGMNISFVLDGIMCPDNGVRPLDIDSFCKNDANQPLRIVSSAVRDGQMETICFGSKENDFFDDLCEETDTLKDAATTSICGTRHGLYACLQASMLVPGATGPPIRLVRNADQGSNITSACFDAFCYEPVPYRSAVEEGATHVLALRTKPEGSHMKTKPGVYERAVAPLYFKSHGQPEVAKFFENGGQQYIYLEDILTLDEGRCDSSKNGVQIPPPVVLYGIDLDEKKKKIAHDRESWRRAHLFPIAVPSDMPELSTLSQDKDDVRHAIRGGFATAFDLLAPAAGLDLEEVGLSAERVAELLFPDFDPNTTAEEKTQRRVNAAGTTTPTKKANEEGEDMVTAPKKKPIRKWLKKRVLPLRRKEEGVNIQGKPIHMDDTAGLEPPPAPCKRRDARSLLAILPTEPWTKSQLSHILQIKDEHA